LQQKIHFISTIVANTAFIKEYSRTLGFTYCGIAKAERLDEEARHLEAWLNKGFHGKMSYMERNFDLRIDPTLLVPGAKSVVTLMLNYFPDEQQVEGSPKISKYAYGKDYHDVIREKLSQLLQAVNAKIGAVQGRGFVDSAPVLERAWAKRSGLGWVGKNANLISKQSGSFFFLATLIIDLPLIYDDPFAKDYCGTCTKCLDACPTDAIIAPAIVDGSKCISYLTIELKDELISPQFADKMEGWMFGCDICQDVCPWNRFSRPHQEPQLQPIPEVLNMSTGACEALLEDDFKTILKLSPIKRSKWKGIQRNLKFLNKN
jgi:epoxyqueuosine reductase